MLSAYLSFDNIEQYKIHSSLIIKGHGLVGVLLEACLIYIVFILRFLLLLFICILGYILKHDTSDIFGVFYFKF
jgi:hypothetical protein